ncbi:MAG: ASCH domain-containing protein [Desulfobaccales bacterium]
MKIKALSLWQPWASLIAVGAKQYETRSWKTDYRGPLLICAAQGGLSEKALKELLIQPKFVKALEPLFDAGVPGDNLQQWIPSWFLPFGKAVAIAQLTACIPTFQYQTDWIGLEATFGDFSSGRYAWKLENVRAIEPFPVKGRQGLFKIEIPEDLAA